MQTIQDALGVVWRGAQANVDASGRAAFSYKAVAEAFSIPRPVVREPAADISSMISKRSSGPGDNIDIWA